ncbi:MAG: HAD-IIA family hydrolase [Melioribacteraceae bacterium]|nr:HAD-IIA family hydrolase [Melioribacteraceae bacterium]MDD3557212.1 HAD-IIA family hydrolase [Melioribacteraceae bacterium]
MEFLSKYETFIFDLDGTIYLGEKLINGAVELIDRLNSLGKEYIFISNKTTGSVNDYYKFLKRNGLNIEPDSIINSTVVLKKFLVENHFDENFYAIGEKSFINELTNSGLKYSKDPAEIKIVIITLDRTFDFSKLEIAAKAIENGAHFYAANIDDTCPVENGEIMDAGATISALEKRCHRKLEQHFGKPSEFMIEEIKTRICDPNKTCLLVGDRLETDIAMAERIGVDSALVTTGVKIFGNGNSMPEPTYKINSVLDILNGSTTAHKI